MGGRGAAIALHPRPVPGHPALIPAKRPPQRWLFSRGGSEEPNREAVLAPGGSSGPRVVQDLVQAHWPACSRATWNWAGRVQSCHNAALRVLYLEGVSTTTLPPQDAAHTLLAQQHRCWEMGQDWILSYVVEVPQSESLPCHELLGGLREATLPAKC